MKVLNITLLVSFSILFMNSSAASPGATWMKKVPDKAELVELSILGTHNACALHGGDYGQCQSLGLGEQLELGVRFIDIRCQWRDGDFHIVHGVADQKMRFSEVVRICQKFLRENPSEMLLMSVMEQRSKKRKQGDFGKTFERLIKQGKKKGIWYQKRKVPTLGEGRGKIVVVTRNKEIVGVPWSAFHVQDKFWVNKKQGIGHKWQMITQHFKGIKTAKKPSINFISCTGIFNPPSFTASKLNPKLKTYLTNTEVRPKHPLGIIVVDYVTAEMFTAVMGK